MPNVEYLTDIGSIPPESQKHILGLGEAGFETSHFNFSISMESSSEKSIAKLYIVKLTSPRKCRGAIEQDQTAGLVFYKQGFNSQLGTSPGILLTDPV